MGIEATPARTARRPAVAPGGRGSRGARQRPPPTSSRLFISPDKESDGDDGDDDGNDDDEEEIRAFPASKRDSGAGKHAATTASASAAAAAAAASAGAGGDDDLLVTKVDGIPYWMDTPRPVRRGMADTHRKKRWMKQMPGRTGGRTGDGEIERETGKRAFSLWDALVFPEVGRLHSLHLPPSEHFLGWCSLLALHAPLESGHFHERDALHFRDDDES